MSDTIPIRIIAFPGAPNLPLFAAMANGFFAAEGLEAHLTLTPSSVAQAERTAAGEFDIAFTAFDNVVAYGEGQGAADVDPDYVAIAGATQLELAIVAAPDIRSVADLKGRSVALDALSTGFAFVLYEILRRAGIGKEEVSFSPVGATPQRWQSVKDGEHAATITIEPFTSIARKSGFNVLALSSDVFESYQGGVIAARREWVAQNPDPAKAFLRAYLKGLEWVTDPANRADAQALLHAKMPEIQEAALPRVMDNLLSPRSGLTPLARLLPEGMQNVLHLRSRFGAPGVTLTDPYKYVDLALHADVTGGR